MANRKEVLTQDQTVISLGRLHTLLQKEANHDGYLTASLAMGVELRRRQELAKDTRGTEATYHLGWIDCLRTFNERVCALVAQQMDAHPHLEERWPRRVRKGQRCLLDDPGCTCLVAMR